MTLPIKFNCSSCKLLNDNMHIGGSFSEETIKVGGLPAIEKKSQLNTIVGSTKESKETSENGIGIILVDDIGSNGNSILAKGNVSSNTPIEIPNFSPLIEKYQPGAFGDIDFKKSSSFSNFPFSSSTFLSKDHTESENKINQVNEDLNKLPKKVIIHIILIL